MFFGGFLRRSLSPLLFVASVAVGWAQGDSLQRVLPLTLLQLHDEISKDSGNVVLVNVWATWCEPCREEMPALVKLSRENRNQKFRLILVSYDDPGIADDSVKPLLRKLGVDFQSYIMNETSDEAFINGMSKDWNGALPATFLYDKKGRLLTTTVGGKSLKQFQALVTSALKE